MMRKLGLNISHSCLVLATALTLGSSSFASSLPDLGSEFRSMLSVKKERLIGEYYMSQIRAAAMVYPDPIINEYISYIGNQLVPYMEMPYPNMRVEFFVVRDKTINAFAFFGGHVAINSGLILITETESEIAGVMSHELAHISQQHLLRQMADSERFLPLTLAGGVAALLIGQPDLLIPVLAGHMQHAINFTRQHEQEADRVGLKILAQANFDPQGLPSIFERMSLNMRYQGKPPEYLLTHPLYESRISDTRHRASTLSYKLPKYGSNMYSLIKAKIAVQTSDNIHQLSEDFAHKLKTASMQNRLSLQYGYACALMQRGKLDAAWSIIEKLAQENPDELIIQMTAADIEAQNARHTQAKLRLERLLPVYSGSPSLFMQYIDVLLQMKQATNAKKALAQYKKQNGYKPDPMFYEFCRQAEGMLGNKAAVYEANAEWYVLHGDIDSALRQLALAAAEKNNTTNTNNRIKNRQQEIQTLGQDLKHV